MPSGVSALCFDAQDPHGDVALLPPDDTGFRIRCNPTDVPKQGRNQIHVDLTSTSWDQQWETVARALSLGAEAQCPRPRITGRL
jgi:hypothetical protein